MLQLEREVTPVVNVSGVAAGDLACDQRQEGEAFSQGGDEEFLSAREQQDRVLAERMRHLIAEESRYQIAGLSVSCQAGVVSIEGTAESYFVKQLANNAAIRLLPNTRFHNNIRVA